MRLSCSSLLPLLLALLVVATSVSAVAAGFPFSTTAEYPQDLINKMMQQYIVNGNFTALATTSAVNRAVAFYTRQSLERDGFHHSSFSLRVEERNNSSTTGESPKKESLLDVNVSATVCTIIIEGTSSDVLHYGKIFSKFWNISFMAYQVYDKLNKEAIASGLDTSAISFSPEVGLPMRTMTSIPLLFFPPDSTKNYSDYQYAQTVTAWWSNMAHSDVTNSDVVRMTRIVDVTALVADATAASQAPFKFFIYHPQTYEPRTDWDAYVKAQLDFYIGMAAAANNQYPDATQTIPIVVMGQEPKSWLARNFLPNIPEPQDGNVTIISGVVSDRPNLKTPVMFSVHPSAILFSVNDQFNNSLSSDGGYPSPFATVMAGQIAAEWNVLMARNPEMDPFVASEMANRTWLVNDTELTNGIFDPGLCSTNKKRVFQALIEKYVQFGYYMKNVDETASHRYVYTTGDSNVDNWVDIRINITLPPNISSFKSQQWYDMMRNSRFVANKILIAGDEPTAFANFVTVYGPDWSGQEQIKIVSPRDRIDWSSTVTLEIISGWLQNSLSPRDWTSQEISGSVLNNGWRLPSSGL